MQGIRDVGLLLARLGFALALIPHGWAKLYDTGLSGTAAEFAQTGIPFPEVSAGIAIAGEFGGSILVALGLITPLAGLVAAVAMFGAVLTAPGHLFLGGGFTGGLIPLTGSTKGPHGEVVYGLLNEHWAGSAALVFGVAALALTVSGPGRFSFDSHFFGKPEWFAARA